jgi:hypothetical protein
MLTLVRDTVTTRDDVAALTVADHYQTREQIEDVLLDRVVRAAYQRQPGRVAPPASPEQAERWLGYLAFRMAQDGSRELAWWRIRRWVPAPFRVLVTTMLTGLACGFGGGTGGAPTFGLGVGLAGGLVAGLTFGPMFALVQGLGGRGSGDLTRIRVSRFLLIGISVAGLGSGGLTGLAAARYPVTLPLSLMSGLASGILAGIGAGVADAVGRLPVGDDSPVDPVTSWRKDLRFGLAFGLLIWLVGGFAYGLAYGSVGGGLMFGLTFGLSYGLFPGLALGLVVSETWPASVAFLQLRRRGLAPMRLLRFLEDARTRGVLGTIGPVYQFRHARLQDRLAAGFLDRNPRYRSPVVSRPREVGTDHSGGDALHPLLP